MIKKFKDYENVNENLEFTLAVRNNRRNTLVLSLFENPPKIDLQIPYSFPGDSVRLDIESPYDMDLDDKRRLELERAIRERVMVGNDRINELFDKFEEDVAQVVKETQEEAEIVAKQFN